MRAANCLGFKYPAPETRDLCAAVAVAEALSRSVYHHHAVTCGDCGAWCFDDVVLSPFGIPVASRRDTMLCSCPEDGWAVFSQSVIIVPEPEAACHWTAASAGQHAVHIWAGGR